MTLLEKFVASFSVVLCCLIIAVGYNRLSPKYHQWHALNEKIDSLDDRLKEIKDESLRVKEYILRFETDRDFVEEQARKARMVTANDLVFVFD